MKAWVQHRYGDADVLELRADVTVPTVGDDDVLVRVQAVGLNAADVHLMTGTPLMVRMVKGLRRPRQPVLGTDFAGVVERVGGAVAHVTPGDVVLGEVDRGSLAELVAAPGDNVVRRPDGMGVTEAAALPMAAYTALQGLRDVGKLQRGERVLVNGASSGVGTYAVQIAVAMGATVVGVCSRRNVELVRSLGAEEVVDYTTTDFTDTADRYDLILDVVSTRPLSRMRKILSAEGRIVIAGAVHKGRLMGMGRQIRAALTSPFTGGSVRIVMAGPKRDDLEHLTSLVESGALRPVIDTVYDFADAPDAMRHLASHRARGKVVVSGVSGGG